MNQAVLYLREKQIEKILKALYVRIQGKHAPAIHNLLRLAELCKLKMTDEYSDWLDTITSFNINARYNDYKKEFHTLCRLEYAESWTSRIKELRIWIKKML